MVAKKKGTIRSHEMGAAIHSIGPPDVKLYRFCGL
jgi:hypothetical protein